MIATQTVLAIDPKGREFVLTLGVGQPYAISSDEWACPVCMNGLFEKLADQHGIDVAVRSTGAHIVDWHHFNFATIAAAIISYCRAKRIPLPYAGVKSLEVTREGIAFHIENTVSIARRPALREDLSGRLLRYARGYEPNAITPNTQNETYV